MRFIDKNCEPKQMSPLSLAFLGDAVYELMVREYLLCDANRQSGKLHSGSVAMVKAEAQAKAIEILLPHLTEDELGMFKRGRNAHPAHTPKNADVSTYHAATGFETLIGYLYLGKQEERLKEFFSIIIDSGTFEK